MASSLFILLALFQVGRSANILGVALHPSYSHQVVFRPIWKHLSLRGHSVTVLTTDPMNNSSLTNLTEIDLSIAYDIWKSSKIIEVSRKEGFLTFFWKSMDVGERIMKTQMELNEVKDLLENQNRTFDLLIVEPVYMLGLGFAERFKCPLVYVLSTGAITTLHGSVGNPTHPLLYPAFLTPFNNPANFLERLTRFLLHFIEQILKPILYSRNNKLLKEYFGEKASLENISSRVSLIFANTNPALSVPRPSVPAMVSLGGGFHLEDPKPLPTELKSYLDNATEGAIYFSLGSNVLSANLEKERLQTLREVFAELPFKVIWKFENETMEGKPDNVRLFKWVPQSDLLRHPNMKVFITQGGLQSIDEALYANVPIVGMPQVADQFFNVKRAVDKGIALEVNLKTFKKEELKEAILKVAQNPRYKDRMRELVDFASDQPMKDLDRVIWWIEYVLRHNGTRKFFATDVHVPFYEYYNLDLIAALLVTFCITILSAMKTYLHLSNHFKYVTTGNK